MVKHMQETPDEEVDQSVSPNVNAEWVNMKGAWVIHVVLVVLAKLIINEIPGISDSIKWTMINLGYMVVRGDSLHTGFLCYLSLRKGSAT